MKVDTEALTRTGGQVFDLSQEMRVGWQDAGSVLHSMTGGTAGNSSEGPRFVGDHDTCVAVADQALEALAGVLEYFGEALYQCAFDFTGSDETTAEGFRVDQSSSDGSKSG